MFYISSSKAFKRKTDIWINMNKRSNENEEYLPISQVYDEIAESFDSKRQRPWQDVIEFVKTIDIDDLVLDLGCGNGRHTKLIVEKQIDTVCLDISFRLLKTAQNNILANFSNFISGFINGDACNLPLKNNSFDKIIMIAILHHLDSEEKRIAALKEIRRILKPSGKALISCWLGSHPRFEKDDLVDVVTAKKKDILVPWVKSDGSKIMRYYYLFDNEELEELIHNCGLKIVSSELSFHNIFIVVEK